MFLKTKAEKLAELLDQPPRLDERVPVSAVKTLREGQGRHQMDVARISGVSQGYISEVESGKKSLSPEMAAKLGPALGVTADQLQVAEQVGTLQRLAVKGKLAPDRLLETILELAHVLPDGQVSDDLVDAFLRVLKKALTTFEQQEKEQTEGGGAASVATKSLEPDRDGLGRRRKYLALKASG